MGRDLWKYCMKSLPHLCLAAKDLNRAVLELVKLCLCLDQGLLTVSSERSAVVVKGDSYASSASPLVLLTLTLIVTCFQDLLQHLRNHDTLHDLSVCACDVSLLDEIAPLVLKRVNALHLRNVAQVCLNCKQCLRSPEAPECAAGERVCGHTQTLSPEVGEAVAPRDVEATSLKHNEA